MDRQDARDARGLEEPSRPLCPSISLTLASLASWRSPFPIGDRAELPSSSPCGELSTGGARATEVQAVTEAARLRLGSRRGRRSGRGRRRGEPRVRDEELVLEDDVDRLLGGGDRRRLERDLGRRGRVRRHRPRLVAHGGLFLVDRDRADGRQDLRLRLQRRTGFERLGRADDQADLRDHRVEDGDEHLVRRPRDNLSQPSAETRPFGVPSPVS